MRKMLSNFSAYKPERVSKLCEKAGSLDQSCLYGALTDLEGVVGDTSLGEKVCGFQPSEKQKGCFEMLNEAHKAFPGKAVNE